MLSGIANDLRFALRQFRRSPGFTAVAVLTLALGIGATTSIFSLLDQIVLRLAPVKDPERLVCLRFNGPWFNGSNSGYPSWSYPWYEDLRDRNEVFEELFCRHGMRLNFGFSDQTERVQAEIVSGNYFPALGVGAATGRVFSPDDDRLPGGHPIAVLSHDFWRNRFDADPDVVGKTILVNGRAFEVIGVSRQGFRGLELDFAPAVFLPMAMKQEVSTGWTRHYLLDKRRNRFVNVFGRLRQGVTAQQAQARLEPLFSSLIEYDLQQPEMANAGDYTRNRYRESKLELAPGGQGRAQVRNDSATALWVLTVMVALLLAIACANVANLLMARAAGRRKEIAVRLALGAGRSRVARQLLLESLLLAGAAGAAALALSSWMVALIVQVMPQGDQPLPLSPDPDARILLFATAVSMLVSFLVGLTPALQSGRIPLASTLKDQAGSIAGGHLRLRKMLVASQMFLSLVLLIGAGLFLRTLRNLSTLDTGFQTERTLAFGIAPLNSGYQLESARLFLRDLEGRLQALPGVDSAGFSLVRLIGGDEWSNSVKVEGYDSQPGEDMNPHFNAVSANFFSTLGIGVREGRDFLPSDIDGASKVGIVNESFAKQYFGEHSAVGRRFGFEDKVDIEIVGVVPDVRYKDMRSGISRQVFVPFEQSGLATEAHLYVRTRQQPETMFAAIRQTLREADAKVPLYNMQTMEEQIDKSLVLERLIAFLAAAFGLLAALLSAVGLYGVLAYSVTRRRREIGLRMALGAQRGDVAALVMKEVAWLFVAGAALALPAALALSQLVRAQLFGIEPHDPLNLVAATAALAVLALAAGYIPALRATRTQPMEALRYE